MDIHELYLEYALGRADLINHSIAPKGTKFVASILINPLFGPQNIEACLCSGLISICLYIVYKTDLC